MPVCFFLHFQALPLNSGRPRSNSTATRPPKPSAQMRLSKVTLRPSNVKSEELIGESFHGYSIKDGKIMKNNYMLTFVQLLHKLWSLLWVYLSSSPETRWTPLLDASTDPKAISKIDRFRDLTPESSLGAGHIDSCRIVMAKLAETSSGFKAVSLKTKPQSKRIQRTLSQSYSGQVFFDTKKKTSLGVTIPKTQSNSAKCF